MTATRDLVKDQREQFAFHDDIVYLHETKRGLTRETVEEISAFKDEPDWMLQFRLRAYEHFLKRPMPTWTDGLDHIDFDKIVYYRKPSEREEKSWDDVPDQIKATFEKLGIPEAERKFLAGVGAQYDSRGRLPLGQGGALQARRRLHGHRPGAQGIPGDLPQVLRHGRAAGGQQVLGAQRGRLVGRLVRVRAEGRRGAAPAAGLLPHQRREHGPVRADPDRRRRGRQGPLHRGLHGARSTPPTRSTSRSSRSSRCPAPRSATRPSRTGRTTSTTWSPSAPTPTRTRTVEWIDANTGSRKTVKYPSIYLRGRGATADIISRRRRRQGPAPGHRRQGHPPRAGHHEPRIVSQVGQQGRRPGHLPRPRSRSRRVRPTSSPASAATR